MRLEQLKEEGVVINNILRRRFRNNKNFLGVTLGPTGSGKSWFNLSVVESYYKNVLKVPFPPENICFSINEASKRIFYYWGLPEEDRKGHLIIFEEAGANLGSLDFSKKEVKKFNQMMQVFRSMNIGILFNLPYMFMLSKQLRTLAHMEFKMRGVDKVNGTCTVAPCLLQYSHHKSDPYHHRPEVSINGFMERVDVVVYNRPSQELVDLYETKKNSFVGGVIEDTIETSTQEVSNNKGRRRPLTEVQELTYVLKGLGYSDERNAEVQGKKVKTITNILGRIATHNYPTKDVERIKESLIEEGIFSKEGKIPQKYQMYTVP